MLNFKKIEQSDLPVIKEYIKMQPFRSCDFTVFGIYLWADYYDYAYCIYKDTFFLKGISHEKFCDYAVPFGSLPPEQAIGYIREFCAAHGREPRFYFVPEPAIGFFKDANIKQLDGWSDYVYSAEEMITLKGRRYNKKRNRLNKFLRGCTSCDFKPITEENIDQAKAFFEVYLSEYSKDDERFKAESLLIRRALELFFEMDQTGGLLYVNGNVVALTIGEVIGDTLFVHVEKALRQYEGAYEAINNAYAREFAVGQVQYINREEDMGDEGLRQAKMAYNPVMMINKYEVRFN